MDFYFHPHLYKVKISASVSKHHEVQIFCYSQLLIMIKVRWKSLLNHCVLLRGINVSLQPWDLSHALVSFQSSCLGETKGAMPVSWILLSSYISRLYSWLTEAGCAVPSLPLQHVHIVIRRNIQGTISYGTWISVSGDLISSVLYNINSKHIGIWMTAAQLLYKCDTATYASILM